MKIRCFTLYLPKTNAMRESMRFYEALPKHKAELVDGKLVIGGSLEKSAMMLGYMVEKLGAAYVAELCPKELLQAAVIETFSKQPVSKLADFTPVEPNYYPTQKMASDLRMGLFMMEANAWGGTMGVKLGEDVFMPDVYILKKSSAHRLKDYYLDGAPDLIIEVVTPYMRPFDFGLRLDKYALAGLPEIWMIDFESRQFEPMVLEDGKWVKCKLTGDTFKSVTIPGLTVQHVKLFDGTESFGMMPLQIFEVPDEIKNGRGLRFSEEEGTEAPFAPRLDLGPVPMTFEEYISWGGEVKFEMFDGKPVFGGGYETTKEWLGMLMMTLGVAETVKYLPAGEWSNVL